MKFTKMQGCGNDYIYVNCFEETLENIPELSIRLSDRHFGIGADGMILICPSEVADFRMRMFNSDGSEGTMCGNGIRCVGKYVHDRGLTDKDEFTVETLAGIKTLKLNVKNGVTESVRVDMGEPILDCKSIPMTCEGSNFIDKPIHANDTSYRMTCVSMGNPHAITYVDSVAGLDLEAIGPALEKHELFPQRANIEFIELVDDETIKMRVWERGSGETLACGTGACASVVATVLNEKCRRNTTVILLGGELDIDWDEQDNHVYMTGPAEFVFDGEVNI